MVSEFVGVTAILLLIFIQHPWSKFTAHPQEVKHISGTQTLQFPWDTELVLQCVL